MNPPTPTQPSATPRTDAAIIASGFQAVPSGFQAFARTIEIELATSRAECELFRSETRICADCDSIRKSEYDATNAELARLRAENLTAHQAACGAGLERDNLRADFATLTMQAATAADRNVSFHLEIDRLRVEVERLKGMRTAAEAIMTDVAEANEEQAIARAERAEAEVERLTVADHAWRTAAKFDAHNAEVLRAEIGRLNTQIATHIRERDGYYEGSVSLRTRAEKAETALTNAKKDSERLNWYDSPARPVPFCYYPGDFRAAIDAAKGTTP